MGKQYWPRAAALLNWVYFHDRVTPMQTAFSKLAALRQRASSLSDDQYQRYYRVFVSAAAIVLLPAFLMSLLSGS